MVEISVVITNGKELQMDKVQGNTVVEALAKFVLLIAQITDRQKEEALREQRKVSDDDIPF